MLTGLLTSQGHSQRLKNDSTCLPNTQLRLALKLIEKGKAATTALLVQKDQNELLRVRIRVKDSVISLQQKRDTVYQQLVDGYQKDNQRLQEQSEARAAVIAKMRQDIKKQKRKTFLTYLAGLLTAAGLAYSLFN